MSKKIAVIGGGGFAREIIEVINMNHDYVYGIFAIENSLDYPYYGYLDELKKHKVYFDGAIIAIGAVNQSGIENRKEIFYYLKKHKIPLASVISPLATISKSVVIKNGVYIAHNVIVSCNSIIDENSYINQGAIIGHDVKISKNVSIAPLVFLGGGVEVEENVMIGVRATIKEKVKIGKNSIVGMGSIVIKNIKENSLVLPQISKIYKN
jgi:sugar O-acyltransferase (sialic acid O-acetyltransferase NeuD family)